MPEAQVTATEYDPMTSFGSCGDEQDLELSAGIEGFQRDYEATGHDC